MDKEGKVKIGKFNLVMIVLLVAAFILFMVLELMGKSNFVGNSDGVQEFVATDVSVAYDANSKAAFYTYAKKDGFFYATKDGISFINADGSEAMSRTYNIASPVMIGEGSVVAVLEKGGNSIYVYNSEGEMYQVTLPFPILNCSINQTGYVSAILKKDDNYMINVFNNKGILQSEGSLVYKNKIPIATDVSNDGRILAICFLDSSNVEINSFVNFYYLNAGEASEYQNEDGLFAVSGDNSDQIIGIIKFMDNNALVTVSDKEIAVYEPEKKPVKKAVLPLYNKISAVSFGDTNYFALAYGDKIANQPSENSEKEGMVGIYDLSLNKTGEFLADGKVNYLYCGLNSVIIGEDRNFSAVTNGGSLIWKYTSLQDTKQVNFVGSTSKILLAGSTEANIIKITK